MYFYQSASRPAGEAPASSTAAAAMANVPRINDGSKLNRAYQNSFKVTREPPRPRSIAGAGRPVEQLQDKIQTYQLKRQGQKDTRGRGAQPYGHSHSHAQASRAGARSQQRTR